MVTTHGPSQRPPTIFTVLEDEKPVTYCRCADCGVTAVLHGDIDYAPTICADCGVTRRERNRSRIQQQQEDNLNEWGRREKKPTKRQQHVTAHQARGRMSVTDSPPTKQKNDNPTSEYRGVEWSPKTQKWEAKITIDGRTKYQLVEKPFNG